jgi:hypothetical protein
MERIETVAPADDSGTLAQSRFFYQHQYTAYWCLQMLICPEIKSIMCEHHDDLVICWRDGHYEFVQVKTRDEGQGEWTLASLFQRGDSENSIIEKLYQKKNRFEHTGAVPHRFVFVSNMGASGQKNDLKELRKLLEKGSPENWTQDEADRFGAIFRRFAQSVRHDDIKDLRRFCLSLEIRTWQPNLNTIRPYNIEELQRILKTVQNVDYPYPHLEAIYEAILRAVRDANLGKNASEKTILPAALKDAIEIPAGIASLLERVETADEDKDGDTVLQRKARAARFDPDLIMLLMDLRASTRYLYRKYKHLDWQRKRLDSLSLEVQRLCVQVKLKADRDALDGSTQWFMLHDDLQALADIESQKSPPLDIKYMIGEVGDLAAKCKIRWATP